MHWGLRFIRCPSTLGVCKKRFSYMAKLYLFFVLKLFCSIGLETISPGSKEKFDEVLPIVG